MDGTRQVALILLSLQFPRLISIIAVYPFDSQTKPMINSKTSRA